MSAPPPLPPPPAGGCAPALTVAVLLAGAPPPPSAGGPPLPPLPTGRTLVPVSPGAAGGAATVGDLRRAIVASRELGALTRGRRLRLIAGGRLLADDAAPLEAAGVRDGACGHCAVGGELPPAGASAGGAAAAPAGSTASAAFSSSSTAAAASSAAAAAAEEAEPTAGFDRLRVIGLAADEVAVLRILFFPEVRPLLSSLPGLPGESEAARILRAEELWMRSQPDDSEFALNLRPLLVARRSLWPQAAAGAGAGAGAAAGGQFGVGGGGGAGGGGSGGAFGGGRGGGGNGGGGERDEDDTALHVAGGEGAPGGVQAAAAAAAAADGTISSFVFGFFAGWIFGALMLFFACAPNASRRFKLGVLSGIAMAAVSQMLRIADGGDAAAAAGGGGAAGGAAGGGGAAAGGGDTGSWAGANKLAEYIFRQ
jgi:hypothetical protein